jgi:hypothetical protein
MQIGTKNDVPDGRVHLRFDIVASISTVIVIFIVILGSKTPFLQVTPPPGPRLFSIEAPYPTTLFVCRGILSIWSLLLATYPAKVVSVQILKHDIIEK